MRTNDKFILDEKGNPVQEKDLLTWARWFEAAGEKRRVAEDVIPVGKEGDKDCKYLRISTIFLGLDHSFGRGDVPIIYETLSWGLEDSDEMQDRYATREEALIGHNKIVALLKIKYGLASDSQAKSVG